MKKATQLIFITCVLAFCSMVYELILAQSLSAFLENTVLRYSVTIGLYMFSMGIGSLLAGEKVVRKPVKNLLRIEVLLTVCGGLSVIFLFALSALHPPRIIFSVAAYALIILIGVLTGFEIPLLIVIMNRYKEHSENLVLAWDYVGAFLGTMIFAFYFYPYVGLVPTSLWVGGLNASCGLLLYFNQLQENEKKGSDVKANFHMQLFLFVFIIICIIFSHNISDFLIGLYIK